MKINEVIGFCLKTARQHHFRLYCEIRENARLTKTLGRVRYLDGEIECIEFSKSFLASATDESVIEVILHELAHAFVFLENDGYHDGHGPMFKAMCARLGTSNDGAVAKNLKYKDGAENEERYKYNIYCGCCGKLVGNRTRACSITKEPEYFISNCCQAPLKVIQNW